MARVRLKATERVPLINRVPLASTGVKYQRFQIRTCTEVERLVSQLQEAYRASLASGGTYSVYRTVGGKVVLAVEIQVPARFGRRVKRLVSKEPDDE